jgi:hypothetical protein
MNITKEQIKEWLLSRSTPENEILPLMVDVIHDCVKDLAPKWVSVDDELPNDGEEVLMYMNDGAVMSDIKCHSGRYSNKYGFERSRVTHWMPLPEPPK